MKNTFVCSLFVCASLASAHAAAANLEVNTTEHKPYSIVGPGDELAADRNVQGSTHPIDESLTRASKPCPPFCVNPVNIEAGVATVAELDVIEFRETALPSGKGVLVDTRPPGLYRNETIPGSVNIPFTVFEKPLDDPGLVAVLEQLGAKQRDKVGVVMRTLEKAGFFNGELKTASWDYTDAKALLLWCNGPWCDQSPRAIRALISMGYPADRLYFYRGGMQMWQTLGLDTVVPTDMSTYASK